MKVPQANDPITQIIQQQNITGGVKPETRASTVSIQEERVDLSREVQDFQKIKKVIDELPDVREDKIQDLKNRIQSGNYNISGEKIAEKMVGESLLDLFA